MRESRTPLRTDVPLIRQGRVAAFVRSHMDGLIPFERTIEQTTETMSLAPKQYSCLEEKCRKLTRAATLLYENPKLLSYDI